MKWIKLNITYWIFLLWFWHEFLLEAKVGWWVVIESKPHQGRCSNLLCHIKSMRSGAKLISSQFSKSFFDDITPDGVNVPAAQLNLTQWLTLLDPILLKAVKISKWNMNGHKKSQMYFNPSNLTRKSQREQIVHFRQQNTLFFNVNFFSQLTFKKRIFWFIKVLIRTKNDF